MSLIVRYLDEHCNIREDFLGFLDCHQENYDGFTHEPILTGEILGETVVAKLNKLGLPLDTCVGIGTDTCSVMLSDQKGAVSQIQKTLKAAIKTFNFLYNHSLNLSISRSSNIQDIRNAVGTIKESVAFFNASSKRNSILKFVNSEQLTSLCETRWVGRHESVLKFKLCFENIIHALELISHWKDNDSSTKAQLLINSLLKTNFIISLYTLSYFLMHGKGTYRPNINTNKPLDYLKISIFIPLLDDVIQDLQFRFNSDTFTTFEINNLIPSYIGT
ncbi:hypothetical protein RI129_009182 [Pyrocoelia pectoralis]|uniref:Uncharacterized protein n=1 Tax=Pyrocoelia pectoralis TaxID=417401 RepID=A0AAN7V6X0_9COLE